MQFPPYGQFARVYNDSVLPGSLAPPNFRTDLAPPLRAAEWDRWFAETLTLLTSTLWPAWNRQANHWDGADEARMTALTLADLAIMPSLRGQLTARPTSTTATAWIPTHLDFFSDEDSGKLGERYASYDATLAPARAVAVAADVRNSIRDNTGSSSIQFKQRLVRPRPYQTALMFGSPLVLELAATSMTSSISSGHCLQGCVGVAGVYGLWLTQGSVSTESRAALAQYCVDIGDRRVFAGVHYPSDNLASWIIGLRLLNQPHSDRRIARFAADAVEERSIVFSTIQSSGDPAFADALALVLGLIAESRS